MEKLKIEGAKICRTNFSGTADQYNKNGIRKFSVIFDVETGEALEGEGWNVRRRPGREEGDPDRYFLDVTVRFGAIPPKVVLVTSRNRTVLDEDTISILDRSIIVNADIVLNKRYWEVNGKSGYKAYLKTGYFTVEEDEFADKYDTV